MRPGKPALLALLLCTVGFCAQAAGNADGDYNFVDLRLRQGGQATAISGSLRLQVATATFNARRAQGPDPAQTITGDATWTPAESFSTTLAHLAGNDSNLRVRLGDSGILVGTGQGGEHELLVAMRKATATPVLRGRYSGAYLRFAKGVASDAETSHAVLETNGSGITSIALVTHSAAGDDVSRASIEGVSNYEFAADGTGTIRFPATGVLSGTMNVAASPDGSLILGTSLTGASRDLLILVRDVPDATESSFKGTYWIAELGGESPYAEQAGGLQLSSADGSLFSFGTGTASIAERVRLADQNVELSTAVNYRLGSGSGRLLGRKLVADVRNFAASEDMGIVVASWIGRNNELTLEHGLLVGVRAPALSLAALNSGSSAPVTASAAPGTLVSLYGNGLAPSLTPATGFPLPTELGGVRVLVNGVPAGLLMVSPSQINFQFPYEAVSVPATVEVKGNASSASVNVSVAPQSPGVFSASQVGTGAAIATHSDFQLVTSSNPARPKETVLIFLTGMGAVTPTVASGAAANGEVRRVADPALQVLFNGIAGKVDFAGLSPGFAGLYQINVVVPDNESVNGNVALGIRGSTSYSDLTDLSIAR